MTLECASRSCSLLFLRRRRSGTCFDSLSLNGAPRGREPRAPARAAGRAASSSPASARAAGATTRTPPGAPPRRPGRGRRAASRRPAVAPSSTDVTAPRRGSSAAMSSKCSPKCSPKHSTSRVELSADGRQQLPACSASSRSSPRSAASSAPRPAPTWPVRGPRDEPREPEDGHGSVTLVSAARGAQDASFFTGTPRRDLFYGDPKTGFFSAGTPGRGAGTPGDHSTEASHRIQGRR